MRKYLILLVLGLIAVPFSTTSFAQANKIVALIKGQVSSVSGEKLKDVQVVIYKGNGERVNTGKTNTDGKFQIIVQPGENYRIGYSHASYYYKEEALNIPSTGKYQEVPISAALKEL